MTNGGVEACDAIDNDCNDLIDDGDPCTGCETAAWGGSTYLFCDAPASWSDAQEACVAAGYHLVDVESSGENTWVYDRAGMVTLRFRWWTGLNDQAVEDTWELTDGTAAPFFSWGVAADWTVDQPSGDGDCVEFRPVIGDYGWNDLPCVEDSYYVCEIEGP